MNSQPLILTALFCSSICTLKSAVLETNEFLLNSGSKIEWEAFKGKPTRGSKLTLNFTSTNNPTAQTLLIEQEDVRYNWNVALNGKKIGQLLQLDQPATQLLSIPAAALQNGTNTLEIQPPKEGEEILLRHIEIVPSDPAKYQSQSSISVTVTEGGRPLPSRITIANQRGSLVPVQPLTNSALAIRTGVVYAAQGKATVSLPSGEHVVYISRGPEYSVSTNKISLRPGETRDLKTELRREVDTQGWVAADTHIHTFTHSRHGDASIEERVVTLAGEAIEFAVATDHNKHIDLRPAMRASGVESFFTPAIGNEVTTARGHFNVFPVEASSRAPDFRVLDWAALFPLLRGTPNVQAVIMNHPTDLHLGFRPFAQTNFNPVTAQNLHGQTYRMDAIELINSAALQSHQTEVFENWFALLNSGQRIVGIGASDSHEVSRFIVGQGRTYIQADDANVANLPITTVCSNLLAGRAIASLGLFMDLSINGAHTIGDLVPAHQKDIEVKVNVQGAAWARADNLQIFANGSEAAAMKVPNPHGAGSKGTLTIRLPQKKHDYWLVAIASGDGNIGPFWTLPKPYQANSTDAPPTLYAVSNPIWIDSDGDGHFTSPRAYAERLVANANSAPAKLIAALADYDEPVASHAASLWPTSAEKLSVRTNEAATHIQRGFAAFFKTQQTPP